MVTVVFSLVSLPRPGVPTVREHPSFYRGLVEGLRVGKMFFLCFDTSDRVSRGSRVGGLETLWGGDLPERD